MVKSTEYLNRIKLEYIYNMRGAVKVVSLLAVILLLVILTVVMHDNATTLRTITKYVSQPLNLQQAAIAPQDVAAQSPATFPVVYFDKDFTRTLESNEDIHIPHIIHQTWKGYDVPAQFQNMSKTWSKVHPKWEYWFWTDDDAAKFVQKRFPRYYDLFKSYKKPILRADAMRYFILYEFGGVYADLDFEAIKDIDVFTRQHYSFLALEPTAHAMVNFGWDYLACNALMGSRPHHPFFKFVIENLESYKNKPTILWQTGPAMITDAVRKYQKQRGVCPCAVPRNETVYLADWKLFMPTLAGDNSNDLRRKCKSPPTEKWKKICDELKENNFYDGKTIPSYSYTIHRWAHTHHSNFPVKNPKDIFQLVENVKRVSDLVERLPQL